MLGYSNRLINTLMIHYVRMVDENLMIREHQFQQRDLIVKFYSKDEISEGLLPQLSNIINRQIELLRSQVHIKGE